MDCPICRRSSRPTTSAASCPDEWDEDVSRAIGAAFAEFVARPRAARPPSSPRTTCASPPVPLSRAFAEGVISRGVDVVEAGLGSTDLLYFAAGSLDLPGAMFTASHNPAQYNGIKLCRAGAAPIGQDSGLATIREWAERDTLRPRARTGSARSSARDVLAEYAAYLHSLVDLSDDPPAEGRGRRRQRHGRAHRPGRPRRAAAGDRPAVLRARRHLPQPRGQPAGPGQPGRPAGRRARARRRHRPGLRRRRRPRVRHRRARRAGEPVGGHRAGRRPRAGQGPRDDDHPQPDHLARRAGDRPRARRRARCAPASGTRSSRPRWPAPTPSSAASTRRTTTSATSGGPTPACSPPCTCSPRWGSRAARCPSWPPPTAGTPPPGRSTPRWTTPRPARRRSGRPSSEQDGVTVDELDGLTVELPDGAWFNLRASNTEPLLRLNVEAPDAARMTELTDRVLGMVRA